MLESGSRTDISALGEFGLIDHLVEHFPLKNKSSVVGPGDDAAVLQRDSKTYGLLSSELYLEGVHFDLAFHPLKHLGFKLVVAGISDILAMNGTPEQIVVNIGLSNRFSLEAVEELYAGIQIACEQYKLDLIGGDTASSRSGLALCIQAYGWVDKKKITRRSGAKHGDLLCVSGDLGGAYMGLQILEREKRVFAEHPEMQPDLEPYDYIVGRQLKPDARIDVVKTWAEMGVLPTSAIDVSDGVASELHHLAKHSGVGFDVYEEKLPIDPQTLDTAVGFDLNPSVVALNGGEDFEVLFTIDQSDYEKINKHVDFSVIGHATEVANSIRLVTRAGSAFDIKAQGWPQAH